MEERNLELDDDGKIKLKKTKAVLGAGNTQEESDIVIEIPDFDGFGGANGSDTEADNALARRSLEREKQRETRNGACAGDVRRGGKAVCGRRSGRGRRKVSGQCGAVRRGLAQLVRGREGADERFYGIFGNL